LQSSHVYRIIFKIFKNRKTYGETVLEMQFVVLLYLWRFFEIFVDPMNIYYSRSQKCSETYVVVVVVVVFGVFVVQSICYFVPILARILIYKKEWNPFITTSLYATPRL
jgi:hypothetical protein